MMCNNFVSTALLTLHPDPVCCQSKQQDSRSTLVCTPQQQHKNVCRRGREVQAATHCSSPPNASGHPRRLTQLAAAAASCREQFFEAARLSAQKDFKQDPKDARVRPSKGAGSVAGLATRSPCPLLPLCCCSRPCLRRLSCAGVGPCWSWLTSSRAQRQMTTSRRSVRACPTRHTRQPRDRQTLGVRSPPPGWLVQQQHVCWLCVGACTSSPPLLWSCCVQAIAKLEQALTIDDKCTDAMWCLGNAYTSLVRSQTVHSRSWQLHSSSSSSRCQQQQDPPAD